MTSRPIPPADCHEAMLTIDEVAERAQCSPRTVARWIAAGLLPVHRLGRLVRIKPEDLRAFEARCRTGDNP